MQGVWVRALRDGERRAACDEKSDDGAPNGGFEVPARWVAEIEPREGWLVHLPPRKHAKSFDRDAGVLFDISKRRNRDRVCGNQKGCRGAPWHGVRIDSLWVKSPVLRLTSCSRTHKAHGPFSY